jgi:eukaryotic-like serine/threonine-protein kinase
VEVPVEAGKTETLDLELEESQGVVFGRPWENGIGMRFLPLGRDLMVSAWETRVQDYQKFIEERTEHRPPRVPDFDQGPDHPIVYVSREDARAFCEWLTERELRDERITHSHVYRLPTDLEWSAMAGLEEAAGSGPGWRDARKKKVFLWGLSWPPPDKSGNFADTATALAPNIPAQRTIRGYTDGFTFTAPVGSFPAGPLGFYDLAGNVHEWVEDNYSELDTNKLGVVRGGGWNSYLEEHLYLGARNAVPATFRDRMYGFRVVLSRKRVEVAPGTTEVSLDPANASAQTPATDG